MSVAVKICGINDPVSMQEAVQSGADYVGLVFYPRSPRVVTKDQAQSLAAVVPPSIKKAGLFVDPSDDFLRDVLTSVSLDIIQLHGDETPERVATIQRFTQRKVMKAIKIAEAADVQGIAPYMKVADYILCDAKSSKEDALPGGNATVFDWSLLKGYAFSKPWMLAGGLNSGNMAEAIRITGAKIIDVSSGVEEKPGVKSPKKIRELLQLAKRL